MKPIEELDVVNEYKLLYPNIKIIYCKKFRHVKKRIGIKYKKSLPTAHYTRVGHDEWYVTLPQGKVNFLEDLYQKYIGD